MKAIRLYWTFARPFTLIPPMAGIFSGAVIASAATGARFPAGAVALALAGAAILNAASNGLNQIFDVEIDRINKPHRPLPARAIRKRSAWLFTLAAYTTALILAACVNLQTFVIYLLATLATIAYSAPPFRFKRRLWLSNLTIALVRGELLKVAGWAAVATVLASFEPWYIGLIYFVFLLGATSTKDFADIEGDRKAGCATLPVRYGVMASARMVSPFFIVPWLIMAWGVFLGILSGDALAIVVLSIVMTGWGVETVRLINRDPETLRAEGENHPAWKQMYWMMMAAHLGLAAAYALVWVR